MHLVLVPTHPDGAGGLAFVGSAQRYFGIVLLAYSFALSGVAAERVVYDKVPLSELALPIALYVILAVLVVLAPLAVFAPMLIKTKQRGLLQYGTLGTEYTFAFHKKWIVSSGTAEDSLLGAGDIQSLADLGNSFGFIEKMTALPIKRRTLIHLAPAFLIPMAPLLLTVMPFKEVVKLLYKLVM
ncbi:hypothetical protein [Granulicella sp. L46]|uniref:hypothetical protein n=1 Tax=Granulicella sp. L46 TaxID=1641865 RepID=UPI00131A8564|nr:hypothetical protein [Granulicella sp. L46]